MNPPTLAAVELRCPDLERSRAFFVDVLGLLESDTADGEVSLRCVGESAHTSVVLRASDTPGLAAVVLHDRDGAENWPAATSDGHQLRVVGERQQAEPYQGERVILNQPTPLRGVGIEPRRLAHVGLTATDPAAAAAWWQEQLGYALRESVADDEGELLSTLSTTPASCEVMLVRSANDNGGGLHHVAFTVDQRDRIADAALLFAELAVPVEVGLGQHGVGQLSYIYFFEPSGNRLALIHSPLWWDAGAPPVRWPPESWRRALWLWGAPPPSSFLEVHT
ncbi:MAG TPA: VOC family protein [Solirubrobacteraceae bacterium]|jgi:catechol 2,3-dioxygenase|nr:VOC family protein [Solirubrobacteraceae bacterium]